MAPYEPQPGDFAVVSTNGTAGWLIRLVTGASVNHAVLYVGDGMIIEAAPSGARRVALSTYDGLTLYWSHLPLTDTQRQAVVAAATNHLGAPYSFLDDACIALARLFGVHVPQAVRDRLQGTNHLMCSQLVDVAYADAGIPLFNDGRLPGDVTPGDLYDLIQAEALSETA